MRVKLENEVRETRKVSVVVRPELYARQCDSCGQVFDMGATPTALGELKGIFAESVAGPDGRSMGNTFSATVCSFACAHEIYAERGWAKLKAYKPYAKAGVELARVELALGPARHEAEIRKTWEKVDLTKNR